MRVMMKEKFHLNIMRLCRWGIFLIGGLGLMLLIAVNASRTVMRFAPFTRGPLVCGYAGAFSAKLSIIAAVFSSCSEDMRAISAMKNGTSTVFP